MLHVGELHAHDSLSLRAVDGPVSRVVDPARLAPFDIARLVDAPAPRIQSLVALVLHIKRIYRIKA